MYIINVYASNDFDFSTRSKVTIECFGKTFDLTCNGDISAVKNNKNIQIRFGFVLGRRSFKISTAV